MKKIIGNIIWFTKFALRALKIRIISLFSDSYSDPYRLMVQMNTGCNYRCRMCGCWKKKKEAISKDQFINSLKRIKSSLLFLSITGGEPFLSPETIKKIVRETKKRNKDLKYISINTNCSSPSTVKKTIEDLLEEFPDLIIFLGLHYIPNFSWGVEKTRIEFSYKNYKRTEKISKILEKKYQHRFNLYQTITISRKKDLSVNPEDCWINFAEINPFYDNLDNNYIEEISADEKLKYINKHFKNKKSFLNRMFTLGLKKIIKRTRKRRCYAGKNRIYISSSGSFNICSRGIKERKDMDERCSFCWTACEANFDLVNDFFLPF